MSGVESLSEGLAEELKRQDFFMFFPCGLQACKLEWMERAQRYQYPIHPNPDFCTIDSSRLLKTRYCIRKIKTFWHVKSLLYFDSSFKNLILNRKLVFLSFNGRRVQRSRIACSSRKAAAYGKLLNRLCHGCWRTLGCGWSDLDSAGWWTISKYIYLVL